MYENAPDNAPNKTARRANADAVKSLSAYTAAHCVRAVNVSRVFHRDMEGGLCC